MELEIKALSDPNGIFKFNNLQAFYANQPSRFQGGIASTLPVTSAKLWLALYTRHWRWNRTLL